MGLLSWDSQGLRRPSSGGTLRARRLKALAKVLPGVAPVARLRAADALERFAGAGGKTGRLSLAQFRAALRGRAESAAPAKADLGLDDATLDALFRVLTRGNSGDGLDFFAFLAGFAVLDAFDRSDDGALDLVFSLLDAEDRGAVPRSRVVRALDPRASLTRGSSAEADGRRGESFIKSNRSLKVVVGRNGPELPPWVGPDPNRVLKGRGSGRPEGRAGPDIAS